MRIGFNRIWVLIIFSLFFQNCVHSSESEYIFKSYAKISIAVMDLKVTVVPKEKGIQITNLLRNKISQMANLISSHEMNRVIKEKILDDLNNNKNIAKLGKLLNADKIVNGLVAKIDDILIIYIIKTDVKDGTSKDITVNCYDLSEKGLEASIEEIMKKLF